MFARIGLAAPAERSGSGGLTAEAAVERVQNGTRTHMLRQSDRILRERVRDLDDLSDRLLRILSGRVDRRPGRAAA